jgi:hypothetical protein
MKAITDDGAVVARAGRPPEPDPDPQGAPYGYTWDGKQQNWRPRKRLGRAGAAARLAAAPDGRPEAGGGPQDPPAPDVAGDWRDPDPAREAHDDRGPAATPFEVSQQTRDDIAGMLALLYSIPADFLVTVDPYCFGALSGCLDESLKATVPIICRSRLAVEFCTSAAGLVLWIKLAAALKPFAVAVFQHHIIHSVVMTKQEDGTPHVEREDWSQYSAAG